MASASARARRVQNIIVAVVALLAIAELLIGLRVLDVGSNEAIAIVADRLDLTWAGGALLASALVSLVWMRWRDLQAKFFFVAAFFALMLAGAEIAARMVGYIPAPPHPSRTYWTTDPELGFVCRKNCTFRYLAVNGWITGTTDATGFRPVLTACDVPGAPSVICLGDSTTFSGETEDQNTWPEAAARYLQSQGKACRMLNRGVYGYSGLQSLLTLRRVLQQPGNYCAVVYHYCFNDPAENFSTLMPAPLLEPDGKSFSIRPPSERLLASVSARRFQTETALQAAFRTWRFSIDDAAFRNGGEIIYPVIVANCDRLLKEPLLRDGMRFVIAGMKEECARHHLLLYVSLACYPFFDVDGSTRAELASLLHPADVARDARTYNESCDWLKAIVTEVGGEFIDIRGCLEGMSFRQYIVSPADWHFSGMANERIGTAIAQRLANRIE